MMRDSPPSVLLVEQSPERSKLLSFALESAFGMVAIEARSSEEALDVFKQLRGLDVVIVGDVAAPAPLLHFLLGPAATDGTRVILSSKHRLDNPSCLFSEKLLGIFEPQNAADAIVNLLKAEYFKGEVQELGYEAGYCRVPLVLLRQMAELPSDVYIRLSDVKYLKLFARGTTVTLEDIERYRQVKKVEYFYVRPEDSKAFFEQCQKKVEALLENPKVDPSLLHAAAIGFGETMQGLAQGFGVTETVRQLAHLNTKLVIKTVEKNKSLNDIYRRFAEESGEYIVRHSIFLGEVACIFASNVEWASKYTFNKLVLAALFHDITLRNNDLAKLSTPNQALEMDPSLLIYDGIEGFQNHPEKAAELIRALADAPPDTDIIVKQHHEQPDGSGFPQKLTHRNLTPLSCLFIVAHDYVDFVMENQKQDASFSSFAKARAARYEHGNFRKIIHALENVWKSP